MKAPATHAGPVESRATSWLDGAQRRSTNSSSTRRRANGGLPLVHVMNYYDTYNKAFNVKDADIDAVLTFYGATTFYGLNDAAWAKYQLGEFLETNDATGKPATANPWRTAPVILNMTLPQASLESLHKRGADAHPLQQRADDLLVTGGPEARSGPERSYYQDHEGQHPAGSRAGAGHGRGRGAGAARRVELPPPVGGILASRF